MSSKTLLLTLLLTWEEIVGWFDNPGWLVAAWVGDEEALVGYTDDDLV